MSHWSFLKGQGLPVLSFLDHTQEELLSAANLYNLAFAQVKSWRKQRIVAGQVVTADPSNAKSFVVTTIAACLGEQVLTFETGSNNRPATPPNKSGGVWFQTSGTKKPKWVFHHWDALMTQVKAHAEILTDCQHLTRLSVLPKKHCFGLIIDLFVGLYQRQTILITANTLTGETCRKIKTYLEVGEGFFACVTPRLLQIFLDNNDLAPHLSQSQLLVGGALLPNHLKNKAERSLYRLWEGYGLTEAGPGVLVNGTPLSFVKICLEPVATHENGTSIFALSIESETLGWIEEHDPSIARYPTKDLVIQDPVEGIKIIGRVGDCLKNQAGTWTDVEQIEVDLKKKFNLAEAHAVILSGQLEIGISEASDDTYKNIQHYIDEKFGIKPLIKKLMQGAFLEQIKTKDIRWALLAHGVTVL